MPHITRKKLFVLLALAAFAGWLYLRPVTFETDLLYIQSGSRLWPINIEVAKTNAQRELGLMHRRQQLDQNAGMLFIFPKEDIIRMQMKNIRIRLDMLFIDGRGKIVYIAQNTTPNSIKIISAEKPVKAVLELKGGITKTREIQVGDYVVHSIFEESQRH